MPEPRVWNFRAAISSPVIDTADQQVVQRDKGQPKSSTRAAQNLCAAQGRGGARAESDRRFAHHFEEDGHPAKAQLSKRAAAALPGISGMAEAPKKTYCDG